MKKRALLVGINRYEDPGISRLLCAEKDALALEFFLRDRCGFDTASLINDQATKRRLAETVRNLCAGLSVDDVFLFYFAGHGHEDPNSNQQLLLPWDVRLLDIRDRLQPDIVPVRGIETASAHPGASRVFVLDACRMPLMAGTRDSEIRMRDVVVADMAEMVEQGCKSNPPLVMLFSCSPNQRAHEIESLGRGAFSKAFEEVLKSHVENGRECSLPGQGLEEISQCTARLLKQHQKAGCQDPMVWSNRGRIVLVEGRKVEPPLALSQAASQGAIPPVIVRPSLPTGPGRLDRVLAGARTGNASTTPSPARTAPVPVAVPLTPSAVVPRPAAALATPTAPVPRPAAITPASAAVPITPAPEVARQAPASPRPAAAAHAPPPAAPTPGPQKSGMSSATQPPSPGQPPAPGPLALTSRVTFYRRNRLFERGGWFFLMTGLDQIGQVRSGEWASLELPAGRHRLWVKRAWWRSSYLELDLKPKEEIQVECGHNRSIGAAVVLLFIPGLNVAAMIVLLILLLRPARLLWIRPLGLPPRVPFQPGPCWARHAASAFSRYPPRTRPDSSAASDASLRDSPEGRRREQASPAIGRREVYVRQRGSPFYALVIGIVLLLLLLKVLAGFTARNHWRHFFHLSQAAPRPIAMALEPGWEHQAPKALIHVHPGPATQGGTRS